MAYESTRAIELADNGGHFYRADSQVHAPRDTQWDGDRPNTAERNTRAATFVSAARSKGLNAVAISDHHDFAFYPIIKRAAAAEKLVDGTRVPLRERLTVFPVLELTLSVPCQAILILDADFPEDRLNDVLKAHFISIRLMQLSMFSLRQLSCRTQATSTIFTRSSTTMIGFAVGISSSRTSHRTATRLCRGSPSRPSIGT